MSVAAQGIYAAFLTAAVRLLNLSSRLMDRAGPALGRLFLRHNPLAYVGASPKGGLTLGLQLLGERHHVAAVFTDIYPFLVVLLLEMLFLKFFVPASGALEGIVGF